jgi:hypothetical protein
MDTSAMNSAGLFFFLTFAFFFVGQAPWAWGVYWESSLLGGWAIDETWSSHAFTLSRIFGWVASVKLYRACG